MDIDILIGQRVTLFRQMRKMSMEALATHLDISTNRLKSYECGVTRIPPTHLWRIAQHLGISVIQLFQTDDAEQNESPLTQEMLENFDHLPEKRRIYILSQIRFLSRCDKSRLVSTSTKRPQ